MDRAKLDAAFQEGQFQALVSEAPQTRLWYAKVQTSDGWLIIEPNQATLFVDGRYFEYAKKQAQNVTVMLLNPTSLQAFFKEKNFRKIAIEADYLTVANQQRLAQMINIAATDFVLLKGQDLRIVKTAAEISKLQKAVDISLEAFAKVQPYLKIGISEKEIDHKLNYLLKRLGAEKEGFDNIIAFGTNTAMPHHCLLYTSDAADEHRDV